MKSILRIMSWMCVVAVQVTAQSDTVTWRTLDDALRVAQGATAQVERRTYGDRTIELFPQVWARSRQADGFDVMGPTLRDGQRCLMLVLVGAGAPRILRLDDGSDVKLMVH